MRLLCLFPLLLLASPLYAIEGCEDVWFTRNLVMDRAGYCFSTPLAQTLFDNSDCTGTEVTLTPADTALLARIRSLEAQHGCNVDTSRTWFDMPDILFRKALSVLPVRMDGQWGCLGWTGPQTPLYSGYHEPFHAIGRVDPGDYVLFEHEGTGQWQYVTVHIGDFDVFKSAGWLYWTDRMPCAAEAG